MKLTLYHGSSIATQTFTKESCFTDNKNTAIDYAYFMTYELHEGEKPHKPVVLHVKGDFIFCGGPDEYKLRDPKKYKIVKVERLPTSKAASHNHMGYGE